MQNPYGLFFTYAYLLRVPGAIFLTMIVLAESVWPTASLNPMLRGVLDLWAPSWVGIAANLMLGTLASMMTATAVAVSARLILLDGGYRVGVEPIAATDGVELLCRFPLIAGVLVFLAAAWQTFDGVGNAAASMGGKLYGGSAIVVGCGIGFWFWRWTMIRTSRAIDRQPAVARRQSGALMSRVRDCALWFAKKTPAGFIVLGHCPSFRVCDCTELRSRHVFAIYQLVLSFGLYLLFFAGKKPNWFSSLTGTQPYGVWFGDHPVFPTLCLVLALLMLACWFFSFLTFWLDRFRVPIIGCLVFYGWLVSQIPQDEAFFRAPRIVPTEKTYATMPALQPPSAPAVVVVAEGGGIQLAAWTARVMLGLQAELAEHNVDFSRHVRLMSGVSGGAVGTMFVAAAYDGGSGSLGRVADLNLTAAVRNAEATALDDTAWGLAYPDLFWSLAPPLKGVYLWPDKFALFSGLNLTSDRASALEDAWRRALGRSADDAIMLSTWGADAKERRRPAVIFNATLVETGERFVIGTADLGTEHAPGRSTFGDRYPGRDLDVVTAARLSASFPYVSPAARMLDPEDRESVFHEEVHVVDGGYYDNYGIVSAVEWMRHEHAEGRLPRQVLMVEIRAADALRARTGSAHGFGFQVTHPLQTLFNVRGSGQLGQASLARDLAARLPETEVHSVAFTFPQREDRRAPLSWHLTPADLAALREAWDGIGAERARVVALLTGHEGTPTP